MGKVKRKWVELDYSHPDSLRAQDIPYDSSYSVKEAIDNFHGPVGCTGLQGPSGSQGLTGVGPQGVTGLALGETGIQGPQGYTGFQGITGLIGETGLIGSTGIQGNTGSQGETGIQGLGETGLQGVMGDTGIQGQTGTDGLGETGLQGPLGPTGIQGNTGIQGLGLTGLKGSTGLQGYTGFNGIQGQTGLDGPEGETGIRGLTGPQGDQGETGLRGPAIVQPSFNTVSRYEVTSTAGEQVWVVSSSTVFTGLYWSRTGTTLLITNNSHGHTVGNRVIVRNTNMDYQQGVITSTTPNTFQITTTNTGATSGSDGAYSLGYTYAHVGIPNTGGVVYAPSGAHADVQLISMRLRTGPRNGTTYDLTVPASAVNGAGQNTSLNDCYMPDFNVRFDNDLLSAVAATMKTGISGDYIW